MKSSEWLVRATQDLPAGVTARVKADTLAHLQDAGIDEQEDVRPLLGRPDDTAAELRRLYLTNKEWLEHQKSRTSITGFDLSEWLILGWPALLLWSVFDDRAPFHGFWFVQGLLAILFLVMLALTWRMHPLRCKSWRLWSVALCSLPMQWTYFNEVIFGGELSLSVPIICAVLLSGGWFQYRRDARLARTLTLEGEQA